MSVRPSHLRGISGYLDETARQSFFSWRWIEEKRVVTMEKNLFLDYGLTGQCTDPNEAMIRPTDLFGINEHSISENLTKTVFGWKLCNRNLNTFRVLTIEDDETSHAGNSNVCPCHMSGVNGYDDLEGRKIEEFRFGWATITCADNKQHRVLILVNIF